MSIHDDVMQALVHLTLTYAEQLARDVQLFARHAKRKRVEPDDIILSGLAPRCYSHVTTSIHPIHPTFQGFTPRCRACNDHLGDERSYYEDLSSSS
ncbi:unnamed protein product [Closterium sp. NIES-64]|nr:unnamed protein product [Closterium sp. NIES-64]